MGAENGQDEGSVAAGPDPGDVCKHCGEYHDEQDDWVLDPFLPYIDKPVALQVKHPVVLVDNFGAHVKAKRGDETVTLGVPQVPSDGNGTLSASPIIAGVLSLSECASRVVLRMRGGTGALVEVTVLPEDVQHVFLIVEPGKELPSREPSRILSPNLGGGN